MTQHLTTDTIIDYVHGELPPSEDALVHGHMQTCGSCRAEFERESQLTEALREFARDQEFELPGMVKARIWEAVRAERPSLAARVAAFLRPAVAVPVAALLLLVTYFASPLSHPPAHLRTVDAMYYLEQHAAEQMQIPLSERNAASSILETSDAASGGLPTRPARAAAALDAVE